MHPGAKTAHHWCTLYACRVAVDTSARRRPVATASQPGGSSQPGRPTQRSRSRSAQSRLRRGWPCARRAAWSDSPTPAASSASAWYQPLHSAPTTATPRDDRAPLGQHTQSRRRTRTPPHRTSTSATLTCPESRSRSPTPRPARTRRANPKRTSRRQESPPHRRRPQRSRNADRTRRRALVAFNRSSRPAPR